MRNFMACALFVVALPAAAVVAAPAKDVVVDPSFNAAVPFKQGWIASAVAVQADGKILVGNPEFHTSFPGPGAVFRLTSTGTLDSSFTPELGNQGGITSLAPLPDGRVLVGGTLNYYNANGGVAMLKKDGSLDTSYLMGYSGSGASNTLVGRVESLLLQPDGKVLVGGQFGGAVPLVNMPGIARLNADGSVDTGFDPRGGTGDSGTVQVIAADTRSKKTYIGGTFVWYAGKARHGIARVNEDGSLDETFTCPLKEADPLRNPTPDIRGIAVQPDGKIIISTEGIVSYGGVPVQNLVRVRPDGSLDTAFSRKLAKTPGLRLQPGRVILLKNGKILVCGATGTASSGFSTGLLRLNPDGSVDHTFPQKSVRGGIRDMVADRAGRILLAGNLTLAGEEKSRGVVRILPGATVQCRIQVKSATPAKGTVKGGRTVTPGTEVTVRALPKNGHKFVCWKDGRKKVSTSRVYRFKAEADRKLTAHFK